MARILLVNFKTLKVMIDVNYIILSLMTTYTLRYAYIYSKHLLYEFIMYNFRVNIKNLFTTAFQLKGTPLVIRERVFRTEIGCG